MSTQKLKKNAQSGAKRLLRLTVTHVPRPRLKAAIGRMKRGEFLEIGDAAEFRRVIEAHKRKLATK